MDWGGTSCWYEADDNRINCTSGICTQSDAQRVIDYCESQACSIGQAPGGRPRGLLPTTLLALGMLGVARRRHPPSPRRWRSRGSKGSK
jgi:MYXO-CTERM domain-containing protein